ncbi:MAG: RNA polymerase factor sigma-54 [Bacteroidota bacterium]
MEQFHYLQLDEKQRKIGEYLLGNLEDDGYIRRDLEVIVNDLACNEYIRAHTHEVEAVLKKIQQLDPPGIAARNLQECLLIQLQKGEKKPARQLAIQIVTETFPAFIRKHYDTILKKLEVADRVLFREAIALISKLNPKPRIDDGASLHRQLVYPDFIVTQREEQLRVSLRSYYTPELSVSKRYAALLSEYETPQRKDKHMREAATFVKQRLTAAQWFIEAIKQRQQTLLHTMETIVKLQHDFFIEEEEQNLKPMILKDVAQEMQADISTISRVVNNKSVQTDLAIYPLKFFFTEGIHTTSGTEVSNRVVKQALAKLIREEDKQKPYPDHKLVDMLQAQGYDIARRTVAKYREQMHMPVARMRREV